MRHPKGIINPFLHARIADNVLNEAFRITGELGIKTFLIFGTCLGFVRDGGYIEGDFDLDIGVICSDREIGMLGKALLENGFTRNMKRFFRYHNNVHFYKDKILLDIYFCEEGKFYSQLESIRYNGRKYPIPYPVDQYLSTCYSNWRKKEKEITRYYGG